MTKKDMNRVAETAIKMEQDSIDFYTEAIARSSNGLGRSMFESLVNDEKRHLKGLQKLLKNAGAPMPADKVLPPRKGTFKSAISTVFLKARQELIERVPSDADDVKALRIALDLEKEGFRFYREAAANAADPNVAGVYKTLQKEENEHIDFLQNTLSFLEDSGNWFLWEEQGLLDGG